ncbi:MAG: exonuclease domain-containing protein [Alphaproteobacteria bacterium]|nr:exonuclease domain-containing protein [Alphaproteobacteria bacterium]MDE2111042.1 exonuclease domain-containing protein [Alphaproteobacteria bacterium]MDE2494742.1 exonuclease domain-containing protein [Alphaproteobacteria bacterium]
MTNHWLQPGQFQEIVQIGAVKVDSAFNPGETLDVLVRPRINSELSSYLVTLTGIANSEVQARGIDFAEAYKAFLEFVGGLPIVAFGRDDKVLIDNFRLYGMNDAPPLPPFIDIRFWLKEHGVDTRGLHACDVAPSVGVPFSGHKHNGLDDALAVAAGIAALIARGARLPLAA